jgi:hypothetical protein
MRRANLFCGLTTLTFFCFFLPNFNLFVIVNKGGNNLKSCREVGKSRAVVED